MEGSPAAIIEDGIFLLELHPGINLSKTSCIHGILSRTLGDRLARKKAQKKFPFSSFPVSAARALASPAFRGVTRRLLLKSGAFRRRLPAKPPFNLSDSRLSGARARVAWLFRPAVAVREARGVAVRS